MIFLWLASAFSVWLVITLIMFLFTMGAMSPIDGAPYRKQYWKYSLLGTFYVTVPIIGWIVGAIHMYLIFKNKDKTS